MLESAICIVIGAALLGLYRSGRIPMTNYFVRNIGIILLAGGIVYGGLTLLG